MGGLLPVVAAALAATAGMATSREAHAASSGPYEASFVEVNQSTGATLFYWYTPAANGDSSAPTVVWLNGSAPLPYSAAALADSVSCLA